MMLSKSYRGQYANQAVEFFIIPGEGTATLVFESFVHGVQAIWVSNNLASKGKVELFMDLDGTGTNMQKVTAIYSSGESMMQVLNPELLYNVTLGVSRVAVKWTIFDNLAARESFVSWNAEVL